MGFTGVYNVMSPFYVEHAKELSSSPPLRNVAAVPGALFGGRGAKHRQLEQMLADLWSK